MIELLAAEVRSHRTPSGLVLESPVSPGAPARCVGDWLVRWARETPTATFLAERDPAGAWAILTYGDALATYLDEHLLFDPAKRRQHARAAHRILDLDHHCGDQFLALGDERIVGFELIGDLLLAALLDVEHLVDLMPHRVVILEIEGDERSDLDAAVAFQLGDALLVFAPILRIDHGVEDVGARDRSRVRGCRAHR